MNADERRWFFSYLCLSAFICGFIFVVPCTAQSTQEGLDSLNDDALLNELASRGLNTLLERAFEVDHVPQAERDGRRSLMALTRLADPNATLTPSQRQQLIDDSVNGIQTALPSLNDPNLLMRQAFVLITQGVEPLVNTLEYWGENPRTQASLRPIIQTVVAILDRATELARSQSDALANDITSPNSPAAAKYEALQKLAGTAEYTDKMAQYYLALSLDAASPQRRQIADDAIEYLQQFDLPDNPDRGIVRNRLAKLSMIKGDYPAARKYFKSVIEDAGNPKPNVAQQYEARYFLAVTEILAKDAAAAQKQMNALLEWQQSNLPPDKESRDGAEAAAMMLKYRIANLKGDNAGAVAILMDLLSKRPDLRSIIYEQLLPKIEQGADLKQLDPLLLRAMMSRGEGELKKTAGEAVDEKALQHAIDAAHEVIRRGISPQIDQQMLDSSELLVPFFLDKLGQKPEAANAFVDFADQHKLSDTKNAMLALDNAQAVIGQLRANEQTRDDPAVTRAYERFLPLAIAEPFNRKQFAFEYARRLQLNGNPKQAIEYYHLVPADDKRSLDAKFLEMVALKQQLEDSPANVAGKAEMISRIQSLADQVRSAAASSSDQTAAKSMLVRTALLAADVARREQNDPQRALDLLSNFESSVNGLPSADSLVNEAMYVRVQSYMAAGKFSDATAELVKLLNKTEGGQGAQIVYNLLEKLNADFDRAQQANDRDAMKSLAHSRAELSGFLVKWAADNKDPNIKKFTYRYKVFDAETQRRAAELEDDPKARAEGMKLALQRYASLESSDNVELYKNSLDEKSAADPDLYDPQVTFGIALIQYDLGDYQSAAARFSKLLTQRKLGTAVNVIEDNGQQQTVDNDQYWEAILKLIRCDQKLNKGLNEAKDYLKLQYVTWGNRVGGKKWKQDFESLRQELIPDFKIDDLSITTQP